MPDSTKPSKDAAAKTISRERLAGVRKRGPLKIADVEYRVQFNEASQGWDVLRNGVATDVTARKKRTSAVASAIRDAKAELAASKATIVVTWRSARQLETVWKGP